MSADTINSRFFQDALEKMKPPSKMGIICIDVTNRCNLGCSNCTRMLENQDTFWDMSPSNFRKALQSLKDYTGLIAIIGGNPVMHRQFEELCKIIVEEVPDKNQRGLWTNHVFKHESLAVETFGWFNLNDHGDDKGAASLRSLHRASGGKGNLWTGNSMHAPLLTAIKDLYGEEEMWKRISECDINQNWSASIVENNGELRAYFCEVAASFDLARGQDFGIEVTPGWWKVPMKTFENQVARFCPGCGAAAKLKGSLDKDETDTYTITNRDIALKTADKKRKNIEISREDYLEQLGKPVTDYSPKLAAGDLRDFSTPNSKPLTLFKRVTRKLSQYLK